jgi:hypothetical protein
MLTRELVKVGSQGMDVLVRVQVLKIDVDTEPGNVDVNTEEVGNRLSEVLTSVLVRVGVWTQFAMLIGD